MSEDADKSPKPPKPKIRKTRWPYPLIWFVPVLVLVAAAYFFQDSLKDRGPEIVITFNDVSQFKPGETPVMRHGVAVGKVVGVNLASDQQTVEVHIRLDKSHEVFANKGSIFWIVRPQFVAGNLSGLQTIMTGPYIEAIPGDGGFTTKFTGLENPPDELGPGIHITLHAPRVDRIGTGSPIYYRGIQVGSVSDVRLSENATGVDIHAAFPLNFSPLVRTSSQFWVVKGVDLKGSIFSGMELKLDSLRSLIAGGVEFATPDLQSGQPAKDGQDFPLFDEAKKEWLTWSPQIAITSQPSNGQQDQSDLPHPSDAVRSLVK
jgi:paraquat-inducible protein B